MNAKTDEKIGLLDKAKLTLAALLLLGGIVAYYYFASQYPLVYRVAGVIVTTLLAFGVAMQSQPGQQLWRFAQGSRIELRKVVWPTRQEALQTTLAVIVFVIIMGVFFWLLDMGLLWVTQAITQPGA